MIHVPKKCITKCKPNEPIRVLSEGEILPTIICRHCQKELPADKFYNRALDCAYCISLIGKEKRAQDKLNRLNMNSSGLIEELNKIKIEKDMKAETCEIYQDQLNETRKERDKNEYELIKSQAEVSELKTKLNSYEKMIKDIDIIENDLEFFRKISEYLEDTYVVTQGQKDKLDKEIRKFTGDLESYNSYKSQNRSQRSKSEK